jgi:hypothetical protein
MNTIPEGGDRGRVGPSRIDLASSAALKEKNGRGWRYTADLRPEVRTGGSEKYYVSGGQIPQIPPTHIAMGKFRALRDSLWGVSPPAQAPSQPGSAGRKPGEHEAFQPGSPDPELDPVILEVARPQTNDELVFLRKKIHEACIELYPEFKGVYSNVDGVDVEAYRNLDTLKVTFVLQRYEGGRQGPVLALDGNGERIKK